MRYKCSLCKEQVLFFPADYKYNKKKYPTTCAFCSEPVGWVIKELIDIKEYRYLVKVLYLRFVLWITRDRGVTDHVNDLGSGKKQS